MAEKKELLVKANNFEFLFDRKTVDDLDIVSSGSSGFHVIHNGRSVLVSILSSDHKKMKLSIEGELIEIEIRDNLDLMLDKMGFSSVSLRQVKEIKAPMPGLVLEVSVTEGQEVKENEKVLILEAMKMENSILTSAPAVIKSILVKPGQAVEKGQVLIELD